MIAVTQSQPMNGTPPTNNSTRSRDALGTSGLKNQGVYLTIHKKHHLGAASSNLPQSQSVLENTNHGF